MHGRMLCRCCGDTLLAAAPARRSLECAQEAVHAAVGVLLRGLFGARLAPPPAHAARC